MNYEPWTMNHELEDKLVELWQDQSSSFDVSDHHRYELQRFFCPHLAIRDKLSSWFLFFLTTFSVHKKGISYYFVACAISAFALGNDQTFKGRARGVCLCGVHCIEAVGRFWVNLSRNWDSGWNCLKFHESVWKHESVSIWLKTADYTDYMIIWLLIIQPQWRGFRSLPGRVPSLICKVCPNETTQSHEKSDCRS